MAELWIGVPRWPAQPRIHRRKSVETWEGLGLGKLPWRSSPGYLDYQRFFGFVFAVSESDPLVLVADSCLPSRDYEAAAPSIDGVVVLRERLATLDLTLDPVYSARSVEGYLPLSAPSAWRYAIRRRLALRDIPGSRDLEKDLADIGVYSTAWEDAVLTAYWQRLVLEREPLAKRILAGDKHDPHVHAPHDWTAVLHW